MAKQIFDLFIEVTVGNHGMVTRLREEAAARQHTQSSVPGHMESSSDEEEEEEEGMMEE